MEKILKTNSNSKFNFINFIEGNFKKNFYNNKNILNVKKIDNYKQQLKLSNKKKYDYLTIDCKNIKSSKVLKFLCYFFISTSLKNKNILIFYKLGAEIRGNNILPVWPNNYQKLTFLISLYTWIKKFVTVFFYFNKIQLILIKLR